MKCDRGSALTMEEYRRWHRELADPKDALPVEGTTLILSPDDEARYRETRTEMLERIKDGTPSYVGRGPMARLPRAVRRGGFGVNRE